MKKSFLIAVVALIVHSSFGQKKLENKIPLNSQYVLTVNTPNILTKMSIAEMEKLPVMEEMIEEFVKERKSYGNYNDADKFLGLNDLGFDFNQKSFAFMESTDSIMYFGYLIHLNSPTKFEALNDPNMDMVLKSRHLKVIGRGDQMIAWNKKVALFITGQKQRNYFKNDPDIYDRYGIAPNNNTSVYLSNYAQQREIAKIWMKDKVIDIFSKKKKKSPVHEFTKSFDDNAAATMWSGSTNFYSRYMGLYSGMKMPKMKQKDYFPGDNTISHLYLNDDNVTVNSEVQLTEDDRKSYENMFNNQLNPKYFDYIDSEKFLSYSCNAYSLTGVLQEMPDIINNYFGQTFDQFGVRETVDLIAVLIDEEAIGKVFCGDAMVVLTDIVERETSYKTFEWDDDYTTKTEVIRSKKETIPEFLCMLSTKDEASVEKLCKLAMKPKDGLKKKEGYYQLKLYRNAPFDLYFIIKDGIIFICNSEQQTQNILANKPVHAIDQSTIDQISKTPFQTFIDGKKIMAKIPELKNKSRGSERERKWIEYSSENMGVLSIRQNLTSDEGLTSKIKFSFTNDSGNGLKYFLHFFNEMYMIEKRMK